MFWTLLGHLTLLTEREFEIVDLVSLTFYFEPQIQTTSRLGAWAGGTKITHETRNMSVFFVKSKMDII